MKVKQYHNLNKLLFLVLTISVIYSVWQKQPVFALFGVGCYMIIISLLKTRVQGFLTDERQILISEKASRTSFTILMPLLLLSSLALFTASGQQQFHYLNALGIILSYITSLGVIIYLITYWYFNKQTGGE